MNKKKISLWVNVFLIIAEIVGFVMVINESGFAFVKYYTQASNIILLIAATLYVIHYFKSCKNGTEELPYYVGLLKYIASCVVLVTFIVVVTVLAPTRADQGANAVMNVIFGGSNLFHHILCPLICVISYVFLDENICSTRKENLLATFPTFLYAAITLSLNIAKIMEGPYIFLYVYEQSVFMSIFWIIAIVGGGFVVAFLLGLVINRNHKKGI